MKKLAIHLTILISIFLTACGGGGATGFKLKFDGQEKGFTSTSSYIYHSTKSFSSTKDGNTEHTSASITTVHLANFDLDKSQALISLAKQKIDKPEQIRVNFSIIGEKGTNAEAPIKPGEYLPENKKFQTLGYVNVFSFDGKAQKRTSFKYNGMKGKVVIDSVTDEKITGSIDITDGENSVKGSFTADRKEVSP